MPDPGPWDEGQVEGRRVANVQTEAGAIEQLDQHPRGAARRSRHERRTGRAARVRKPHRMDTQEGRRKDGDGGEEVRGAARRTPALVIIVRDGA